MLHLCMLHLCSTHLRSAAGVRSRLPHASKCVDAQGAGITAFVLAMVTAFKPNWARWSAPLYAAVKGFFLGAISLFFELQYPGIAMSAVLLTLSTTGGLLALYKGNFIRVTDRFRNIITTGLVRAQF